MNTATAFNVVTSALPGSQEWKDAHKGRIGGSTVADILGVGRRTKLRAWAELTGKIQPDDISKLPHIRRGVALEPVVRTLYEEKTGRTVLPSPGLVAHPQHAWLAGTPDGMVAVEGRQLAPWEAKTFGFFKKGDWANESIPLAYQVQVHVYMVLLGVEWCSMAAMPIDDDEDEEPVLCQDVVINPVFADWMMDELVQFREKHWLTDIPPEGDWEKDRETVRRMFPRESEGQTVELTDEAIERWMHKEELASQRTELSKQLDAESAWLEAFMGTAEYALGPGWKLRYKVEPRKGYTVAASEPRVLRQVKA